MNVVSDKQQKGHRSTKTVIRDGSGNPILEVRRYKDGSVTIEDLTAPSMSDCCMSFGASIVAAVSAAMIGKTYVSNESEGG